MRLRTDTRQLPFRVGVRRIESEEVGSSGLAGYLPTGTAADASLGGLLENDAGHLDHAGAEPGLSQASTASLLDGGRIEG